MYVYWSFAVQVAVRKDIEPEEGYNSEFHLEMDQPQDTEKEMLSFMISQ